MNATDFFQKSMLNVVANNTAIVKPSRFYITLYDGNPTEDGMEVSYEGYSRLPVNFEAHDDANNHTGYICNSDIISFTDIPDTSTFSVDYVAIFDSVTSGNMWLFAALRSRTELKDISSLYFGVQKLKFTFSGDFSDYYRNKFMNLFTPIGSNCLGISHPYIALYTSSGDEVSKTKTENGTTTNTGYERIAANFTLTEQRLANYITNNANIIFPESSQNWDNIRRMAIVESNESTAKQYAVFNTGDIDLESGDRIEISSITFSFGDINSPIF